MGLREHRTAPKPPLLVLPIPVRPCRGGPCPWLPPLLAPHMVAGAAGGLSSEQSWDGAGGVFLCRQHGLLQHDAHPDQASGDGLTGRMLPHVLRNAPTAASLGLTRGWGDPAWPWQCEESPKCEGSRWVCWEPHAVDPQASPDAVTITAQQPGVSPAPACPRAVPQHPLPTGTGCPQGIPLPAVPTQVALPLPACEGSTHLSLVPTPGPFAIAALMEWTFVVFGLDIVEIMGVKGGAQPCTALRYARNRVPRHIT